MCQIYRPIEWWLTYIWTSTERVLWCCIWGFISSYFPVKHWSHRKHRYECLPPHQEEANWFGRPTWCVQQMNRYDQLMSCSNEVHLLHTNTKHIVWSEVFFNFYSIFISFAVILISKKAHKYTCTHANTHTQVHTHTSKHAHRATYSS